MIKGLNTNKSYTITVTAINGAGKSVSSSRSKAITASVPTKPNPVRNLKVVARGNKYLNGTYTFMWNSPKASPRKPVDSYLLTLNEYKKTDIFYKKKLKSNKLSYLMTREEIVEAYVAALERKLKVRGELTKSIKVVVTLYAVNSAGMSPEVSDRFTLWVN